MEDTTMRKNMPVRALIVELDSHIYQGLERYAEKFGRSKRWIIEDALNCWIIQRDMEDAKRQGVPE